MRAAVLERFGADLALQEVPDPTPGPGEVIVRTRAAGVCRTDLKVIDGLLKTVELPRIPGHEIAGEVVALGTGVTTASEGDEVVVGLDVNCGACHYCRIGELDHCDALRRLGMELDGGLAEYVRVPAANLIPRPESVDVAVAATIGDAVGSPYHAVVHHAKVGPGHIVAVYGLGGLGLTAVQAARLAGADVIAIARTPRRREVALELGARWAIDPRDAPVAEQVRELTGGLGVHAFLDIVGIEGSIEQAVLACRKGGRVVVVGYSTPEVVAPMVPLVYNEISITGARGSTRKELHEVVDHVAQGRIVPVVGEELALDEVNEALARLRDGHTIGRPVVRFP